MARRRMFPGRMPARVEKGSAKRGAAPDGAGKDAIVDLDALLGTGEVVLGKLEGAGVDSGEVFLQAGWGRSYTLDGGVIKYGSYGGESGMGIRIFLKGRPGFSYCTSPGDVSGAVRTAVSLSRVAPRKPWGFAEPTRPRRATKVFDPRVLDMEDPEGLEMLRELVEGAREVHDGLSFPGGGVSFGAEAFCVLNTDGVRAGDTGTFLSAGLSTMLGKEGSANVSTGSFDDFSRTAGLEARAIGARAARLAVDSRNAKPLERGGPMDVVLAPDAFSELAEHLLAGSFPADRAARGESAFSGKVGEPVAGKELNVSDDGLLPNGPNTARVDDEGVPSRRLSLIRDGVLKGFNHDCASAAEQGKRPTGSAVRMDRFGSERSFKVPPRAQVRNLVMEWKGAMPLEKLIGGIDNGVYVHELLGSHTANRMSGDFSIGSPLLFRIHKGELGHPLRGVMLAGNFFSALENMGGMGDDIRNVTGSLTSVAVRTPSVWMRDVNVMN